MKRRRTHGPRAATLPRRSHRGQKPHCLHCAQRHRCQAATRRSNESPTPWGRVASRSASRQNEKWSVQRAASQADSLHPSRAQERDLLRPAWTQVAPLAPFQGMSLCAWCQAHDAWRQMRRVMRRARQRVGDSARQACRRGEPTQTSPPTEATRVMRTCVGETARRGARPS